MIRMEEGPSKRYWLMESGARGTAIEKFDDLEQAVAYASDPLNVRRDRQYVIKEYGRTTVWPKAL